ncbi:hypothetical protein HZS_1671 [Henneguya salminicola]|nr:hypothetical protein HZS_1671 [Henneguya salminicola]
MKDFSIGSILNSNPQDPNTGVIFNGAHLFVSTIPPNITPTNIPNAVHYNCCMAMANHDSRHQTFLSTEMGNVIVHDNYVYPKFKGPGMCGHKYFGFSAKRRSRPTFDSKQIEELEACFRVCQYVYGRDRTKLAQKLGLSEKQVKIWFQNKRSKMRKLSHCSNPQPTGEA